MHRPHFELKQLRWMLTIASEHLAQDYRVVEWLVRYPKKINIVTQQLLDDLPIDGDADKAIEVLEIAARL